MRYVGVFVVLLFRALSSVAVPGDCPSPITDLQKDSLTSPTRHGVPTGNLERALDLELPAVGLLTVLRALRTELERTARPVAVACCRRTRCRRSDQSSSPELATVDGGGSLRPAASSAWDLGPSASCANRSISPAVKNSLDAMNPCAS